MQWLDLVCQMVPDTRSAILKYTDGEVEACATWPNSDQPDRQLMENLEFAAERDSLVTFYTSPILTVISPIEVSGNQVAVLALKIHAQPDAVEPIKRLINWSVRWLTELLKPRILSSDIATQTIGQPLFESFLSAPEQDALLKTTSRYLTEHYALSGCQLMMYSDKCVLVESYGVEGVSFTKQLQSPGCTSVLEALEVRSGQALEAIPVLEELLGSSAKGASYRVFIVRVDGLQLIAFLSVDQSFDEAVQGREIQHLLEQCCALLLVSKKLSANNKVHKKQWFLVGAKFDAPKIKRFSIAALVILGILCIPISYEIPVTAGIEGKIQKSIVAPFDSFIKSTELKAGDNVDKGSVIAELDDQQLILDVIQVNSLHQEYEKGYRKALAERDYGRSNVYKAKLRKTSAQLKQIELKLDKASLKSPISGVIISGDLSRELGAPVAAGDLLFQVAPLNQYRVMLKVQESDIRFIKEGQGGVLKLSALPGTVFNVLLLKPSPLFSEAGNKIVYLAEAALAEKSLTPLRPGMEGVARINVGSYSLAWVLSHHFIDWLRIIAWKFWL
jgi:hypothetical protein